MKYRAMNLKEIVLAGILRAQSARFAPPWAEHAPPVDFHVRMHPGEAAYDYISGPEFHVLGSPRRNRKVWAIRYGVPRSGPQRGIAIGGFSWAESFEAAIARLIEYQCAGDPQVSDRPPSKATAGVPYRGPNGLRLECAAGRYMSEAQLRAMDAAQDRVLEVFYAIGDCYEREGHPCAFDTLAACNISWESTIADPSAHAFIEYGGEGC